MPSGRRRLVWAGAVAVVVLVLGRWMAVFATERLWEASVSEAAALVGTRFALYRAGLELIGLAVAVGWFAGHFAWIARSIVKQGGAVPRPFAHLSERLLYQLVIALGAVVGVGVGGGTGQWLHIVLLSGQDLTLGVADPLLGVDLGVFAAGLPLWELLYTRAVGLVVPALIGVVLLATAGGLLRLEARRIRLLSGARRQIASLLVLAALLIAWGYALEPFRLAAVDSARMGPAEYLLRTTVSQVIAGLAMLAALLTLLWAIRLRPIVAVGGWVGLTLATLGGSILVRSRTTDTPLAAAELQVLRRVDSVAVGVRLARFRPATIPAVAPSLWDRASLASLARADTGGTVDAWPGAIVRSDSVWPAWVVIRTRSTAVEPELLAVPDDGIGPSGGIVSLRPGSDEVTPGAYPLETIARHDVRPGAPEYVVSPNASGVALSSAPRRLALAWSLQAGELLGAQTSDRVAWKLDPLIRLAGVAPFAEWESPRAVLVDGGLIWIVDGYLAVPRFPVSRLVRWRSGQVGYLKAAFVGVVRADGGQARVHLRRDADPLALAWARVAAPLVEPAEQVPHALASLIGVPPLAAAAQAQVLSGPAWLDLAVASGNRESYPLVAPQMQGTIDHPFLVPLVRSNGQRLAGLLQIPDSTGAAAFLNVDSALAVGAPRDLQARWERFPFFQQLRDSVRAAGSELTFSAIRFGAIGDTLIAYQPGYALGPDARGGIVLVNVAMGQRLGGQRTYEEAWRNLRGELGPDALVSDPIARLDRARYWLERADAALARGDLQEFGRAFAALRELIRAARSLQTTP
ncbi:MAG: UPF0182 family protein [Gemmatimonadales bacterium]|nr:UPF0182 family protein [Gemmatimonadales bacterium]